MRKAWYAAWTVIGIVSAISVSHDWYSGNPAHESIWMLAISGSLWGSVWAVQRLRTV